MFKRRFLVSTCGAAILGLVLVAPSLNAWGNANGTTYLTFSGPVALPGVSLPAGTYIFDLPEPSSRTLVRVTSRDRSKVYLLAFTNFIARPTGLRSDQMVTFGEATASVPPPITAWYPVAESTGRQFVYKK